MRPALIVLGMLVALACARCSVPDAGDYKALVAAVDRLRTSDAEDDRSSWKTMAAWSERRVLERIIKARAGTASNVAIISCGEEFVSQSEDDDEEENTDPAIQGINIPTGITLGEVLECMKNDPFATGVSGFSTCVRGKLSPLLKQWESALKTSGMIHPDCKIVFLPGFNPDELIEALDAEEEGSERIALELIGASAPPKGVNLRTLLGTKILILLCAQSAGGWGCSDSPDYPAGDSP